jgi:hypothetical protein
MKNLEKVETLLQTRIKALSTEMTWQRWISTAVSALAAMPLAILGIAALDPRKIFDGGFTAMAAATAAIGLAVLIWNLGGTFRERSQRAEKERERLENMQLCLLAVPEDQIRVADLFTMLSRKENPFGDYEFASTCKKSEVDPATLAT